MTKLLLADGTEFIGSAFGAECDSEGEVVFTTNMSGYPETLTDPSFAGQMVVFTYPLIGNYGIPSAELNNWGFSKHFESEKIHATGVVVSQASTIGSHFSSVSTLDTWLKHHNIPGIAGIDTRQLTKKLREHGTMLGRIVQDDNATYTPVSDPAERHLVSEVSCKDVKTYEPVENLNEDGSAKAAIVLYDCGVKNNILRSFLQRGITVHRVPHDYALNTSNLEYQGVFVSNGPGDPKQCTATINQLRYAIAQNIPVFGICLGTQLLSLAIGADTYKLPYGHRGANQPCIECTDDGELTKKAIMTAQNHGYAVNLDSIPDEYHVWWINANDQTVEGIKHKTKPIFAVQFHPEACPGPEDAGELFDEFIKHL